MGLSSNLELIELRLRLTIGNMATPNTPTASCNPAQGKLLSIGLRMGCRAGMICTVLHQPCFCTLLRKISRDLLKTKAYSY